MTVGSRGLSLQDSSGKRQEWISLQLQQLKLTDTTTKLRVGASKSSFTCLGTVRRGDVDGFFDCTLDSILDHEIESDFDPRFPQLSEKQDFQHFSVVSNDPSEFQEQVKQRNRQRLLSTWLSHRQGTPFTGRDAGRSICSDTKLVCRRARLSPLMPSTDVPHQQFTAK